MNKIKKKSKNNDQERLRKDLMAWLGRVTPVIMQQYQISGITVFFHERKHPLNGRQRDNLVLFSINYSEAYKNAHIYYYPITLELFEKKRWNDLQDGITHEIAHIITNHLADLAKERFVNEREVNDALEKITESFAQMGRRLLEVKKIKIV
jgi:hypothetical protein